MKMAKKNALITFCENSVDENERMLYESCYRNQVEIKSKEAFEKLFRKLNHIRQVKPNKEDVRLNSTWCNRNVKNYIYGAITGFPPGSWWGIRMDCSRDRVHDPFDENVQNGPFGVTSICTSNTNLCEDIDYGNSLTITGQKYDDGDLDKDPLVKNYEDQIPIRVVRSYNLFNQFAPKTGYRYDGLYLVVNFWIGVNSDCVKHYKFALLRLDDQEPPSWSIKQPILGTSTSAPALSSLSTTPIRNGLKNITSNVYEFKKYSHGTDCIVRKGKHEKSNGYSLILKSESKKLDEKEKGTTESAIVTRHVFKKCSFNPECTSNMPSVSPMSENKSLNLIGNQGSKTHNTNISIRTGLYNSSHSTQQDNKKNTSSPFCRSSKSLNITKTNQPHLENRNSPNKDKSRNVEGKNEFPKRIDYISFHPGESKSTKTKIVKDTDIQINYSTNDTNAVGCLGRDSDKPRKETTNDSIETHSDTPNLSDTPTNMLNITNCMYKNELPVHKMSLKEEQDLKTLDSLDSLTPDKILHLINNKGHPLSKLLMGNMIGLTSEQSLALSRDDPKTEQPSIKDKVAPQQNVNKDVKQRSNFDTVSDELTGSMCYKFRRRRRLSRKIINKPEMIKYTKLHNEKLKKGFAQTSVKQGQHLPSFQNKTRKQQSNYIRKSARNIKNNVGKKRSDARMRLRAMRTIDSSMKKHVNKKQRREIANLLIDAKIEPKVRGPRYRRLRSINNTFAKKYESERLNVNNRNTLTKMTTCKHVKRKQNSTVKDGMKTLSLEQRKLNRNLAVSKEIDKSTITKDALSNGNNTNKNDNDNDNMNNKVDNNKKSKYVQDNVQTVEDNDILTVQSRKRRLLQAVCTVAKSMKIEQQGNKDNKKEISKPSKTDAVTQCSLLREPLTRNLKSKDVVQSNGRVEQYTFIKIEYSDMRDVKSEACDATKSHYENKGYSKSKSDMKDMSCKEAAHNMQHSKNVYVSLNNNTSSTKEQEICSSPERVSAFVPVNIPDNDIKIARLRSIGFKPISSSNNDEDINGRSKNSNKVLKQNVAEKYNKYTNEENDIVVYMDDELQYQDIENEDKNSSSAKRKASGTKMYASIREDELCRVVTQKDSVDSALLEHDLESPWHGWRKVVTNEDTYWVGW